MVMGAMGSGGLQGKKTYVNTVGKLPDAERSEIAVLERHAQVGYAKARSAGFSHDEAALSAYALNEGKSRHEWHVERALRTGQKVPSEVLKDYPDLAKQYTKSNSGLEVTYSKKGDLSSANVAKKIKGAIAGVKGGKVVKGVSPRDRASKEIRRLKGGLLYQNGKVVEYGDGKKFSQADRVKASDLYLKELNDELNSLRSDRKKDIKLDTNPITGERNKRPKSNFSGKEKELLARRKAFEAYIKPDKDFMKELQKYSK